MTEIGNQRPLKGLKILDLCQGRGDLCGRYLADLGAHVILVEPTSGSPARHYQPLIDGTSAWFATHNINKHSLALDAEIASDQETFFHLALSADLIIYSRTPTALRWIESIETSLRAANPGLVTLAISDFGDSGPYTEYRATNAVHMAMTGVLARSGIKDREPLLPPGQLAYEASSIQAAWVALVAYWQRLHTGQGGAMDLSIFEATCQLLDPSLGVTGSAALGKTAAQLVQRGRPPVGKGYPFFPCSNGYVRVCVLNPRQWQAMRAWLGNDHPYQDPIYDRLSERFKHQREINLLIANLFANLTSEQLVIEGQQRGIPIATVATPKQVLQDPHFTARKVFVDLPLTAQHSAQAPSGFIKINGQRMGVRSPAPPLNSGTASFSESKPCLPAQDQPLNTSRRPLEGIRVIDLGVIVAGAELGRLFADQGAEVIKIESKAYPDGLRQTLRDEVITESFAQGSRGKKSLGLNLRSENGRRIFKKLVAGADIVASNFKPGTMDSLGFGYDQLKAINPRIIVSESSALGGSGPMSRSMGYGPLVRASSGLSGLWRYPSEEDSFADSITIIPDHLAARVSAVAILALLIERERSGQGGTVSLSQAETILMCLSTELFAESLRPGSLNATGNVGQFDSPANIFPCAGDDEWCAIEVCNNSDWHNLCQAIGRQDLIDNPSYQSSQQRLANRQQVEDIVCAWTQTLPPRQVMETLQKAGVAAGMMQRISELPNDPHLLARDFFRINKQPGISSPLLTENGPVGRSHLPEPEIRPAPLMVQHTREVISDLLQMGDKEIDTLIANGDLEVAD